MEAEGTPGGLLVVAEAPGRHEDGSGRPFTGVSGRLLRELIAKHWGAKPVVFDNGVRCHPGGKELTEKHSDACRVYTARVLRDAKPKRIIALGGMGAHAILGRKPLVMSVRRGYGWWIDDERYPREDAWIPVYFTMNPAVAMRNRFWMKQFESDMEWALTAPVPSPTAIAAAHTRIVDYSRDHALVREWIERSAVLTFDTETSGVMFDNDFRVEMVTLYDENGEHGLTWDRAAIESTNRGFMLKALLQNCLLDGHNTKYDALAVWLDPAIAVDISEQLNGDTRIYRKLLMGDVDARLEVTAELVGMGGHKAEAQAAVKAVQHDLAKLAGESLLAPLKSGKARKPYEPKVIRVPVPEEILAKLRSGRAETMNYAYRYIDHDVCTRYNARDAFSTVRLTGALKPPMMNQPHLRRCWEKIMLPAMRGLVQMEHRGVLADLGALRTFEMYLEQKIKAVDARLKQYGDVNYNSPPQLGDLLFNKLKLPKIKLTESGADSTDKEVLEELEGKHPIIGDIIEHRRLSKLDGTYARGMRAHIRDDGAIHSSFLQMGAGTGRGSSHDPNLQNIPTPEKDDELGLQGIMARNVFRARSGYLLLEADYKQLELYVAAMDSDDAVMMAQLTSGKDFHDQTAELIAQSAWGLSPQQFAALNSIERKAKRRAGKTSTFQVLYDLHPEFTLSKRIGSSIDEARRIVDAILSKFKALKKYIDAAVHEGKRTGGVGVKFCGELVNWRPLPALGLSDSVENRASIRNAENGCANTKIQGQAAHYAFASLWPLHLAFRAAGLDAHLVLTVHDSIMVEVRRDQVVEAAILTRQVMTSWPCGKIPLAVDLKYGERWGELEEL